MEIVFDNVSYSYKNKKVFNNLNLKIESNKITGITGDNKTILCLLIDGIKEVNHGSIAIGDTIINQDSLKTIRNQVSMIKQLSSDQFFTNKVKEEIMFLLARQFYKPKDMTKKITQAFKMVGLDLSILDKNINTLTVGEKKLFQIAISLLYNPDIIIFDEAFATLDRTNKKRIIKLIKELKNKYKKTVIISSNDINLLYELTDNIVVLKNKNVLVEGKTSTTFQDIKLMESKKIELPDLVRFTYLAKKKKIKLSYHTDILDLIKDVYKHV